MAADSLSAPPMQGRAMTRRFLAIGECMMELAPRGDGGFDLGFAGDTFNTAWYVRRVAQAPLDVAYLSAVGTDAPSRQLEAFIEGAGLRPVLARRPGRGIGLYLIMLDAGERSFAYWRDTSAARTLADDLEALPDLVAGDMAYVSGITLAILPEAGRARLLSVLASARAAGVRIAFDPNLRPRLWEDAATLRHWIGRGAGVADIVLPSFEDEAAQFGDADTAATAARYAAAGAGIVIVKDGPRPVLVADARGHRAIAGEPVGTVVDTTAAGDSFNAEVLVGLLEGRDLDAAVRRASALARRVIGARGALVAV